MGCITDGKETSPLEPPQPGETGFYKRPLTPDYFYVVASHFYRDLEFLFFPSSSLLSFTTSISPRSSVRQLRKNPVLLVSSLMVSHGRSSAQMLFLILFYFSLLLTSYDNQASAYSLTIFFFLTARLSLSTSLTGFSLSFAFQVFFLVRPVGLNFESEEWACLVAGTVHFKI